MKASTGATAVAAAVAGVGLVALMAWTARPPDAGVVWRAVFVATSLGSAGLLVVALHRWSPTARTVMAVAVMLRVVVFPMPPTLSDDGYRYVWDGVIQADGVASPYALTPSDPGFDFYRDSGLFESMNSPDYYSVYPPASQLVFWLAGHAYSGGWERSWLVIKAVIVLVELAGVWALVLLCGARGAALYAWHPLAVMEVSGQGHTEGLLVGALGVLLVAARRRTPWAGGALAFAGWVKLYPFALAPTVLLRGGHKTAMVFVAAAVGLALPYASVESAAHVLLSVGLYLGTFDFYSAPYRVLKSAVYPLLGTDAGGTAASALMAVWLTWAALLALTADGSYQSVRRTVVGVLVGFVITTSTLHPWHVLPLLFVLPLLHIKTPLFWLSTFSSATYLSYVLPESGPLIVVMGWGGGAALGVWSIRKPLLETLMRRRAWGKWRRLEPFVPAIRPGGRILDLGAGEGYVGDIGANALGLGLTSIDVVPYGTGPRTVEVVGEERLPYSRGAFDLTLLVFTLHHAREPEVLLREAARVTRGPILVLETVWTPTVPKRWLERVDRPANRIRSGAAIDEGPLDIRTDVDWRRVFAAEGLRLEAVRCWSGLHPQVLYRLRGHGATPSNTESAVAVRASSQSACG